VLMLLPGPRDEKPLVKGELIVGVLRGVDLSKATGKLRKDCCRKLLAGEVLCIVQY
jgi:hypothetical protein